MLFNIILYFICNVHAKAIDTAIYFTLFFGAGYEEEQKLQNANYTFRGRLVFFWDGLKITSMKNLWKYSSASEAFLNLKGKLYENWFASATSEIFWKN